MIINNFFAQLISFEFNNFQAPNHSFNCIGVFFSLYIGGRGGRGVCVSKCVCSSCLYCALPHIWLCLHCHSTGVCLEASGLVSQGSCTGSFPGQIAATLPELAQYQTLQRNVLPFFFFFLLLLFVLVLLYSVCSWLSVSQFLTHF